MTSRTHWKAVKALAKMFSRYFIREYLPTLQIRKKWQKVQRKLKQKKEDNIPRSHWSLVRVILEKTEFFVQRKSNFRIPP